MRGQTFLKALTHMSLFLTYAYVIDYSRKHVRVFLEGKLYQIM